MYLQSASATLTPQGRAIKEASEKFGDGGTLPFTPCKKGFIPIVDGVQMYACPLHHKARHKRVEKSGGKFRKGEFDLNIFWFRKDEDQKNLSETDKSDNDVACKKL